MMLSKSTSKMMLIGKMSLELKTVALFLPSNLPEYCKGKSVSPNQGVLNAHTSSNRERLQLSPNHAVQALTPKEKRTKDVAALENSLPKNLEEMYKREENMNALDKASTAQTELSVEHKRLAAYAGSRNEKRIWSPLV